MGIIKVAKILISTLTMSGIAKVGKRENDALFITILGLSASAYEIFLLVRSGVVAFLNTPFSEGLFNMFKAYIGS